MNEMDHKCALVISTEDSVFYEWSPSTNKDDASELIEWAGEEGFNMVMEYFDEMYHVSFYPKGMDFVASENFAASPSMEVAITSAFLVTFYEED